MAPGALSSLEAPASTQEHGPLNHHSHTRRAWLIYSSRRYAPWSPEPGRPGPIPARGRSALRPRDSKGYTYPVKCIFLRRRLRLALFLTVALGSSPLLSWFQPSQTAL